VGEEGVELGVGLLSGFADVVGVAEELVGAGVREGVGVAEGVAVGLAESEAMGLGSSESVALALARGEGIMSAEDEAIGGDGGGVAGVALTVASWAWAGVRVVSG
jgi:hypothetical protein